jgi:hypothetical protein
LRTELVRGSKGNLLLKVLFEEKSNFDTKKMEWVPTIKEMELLSDALDACLDHDKKTRLNKK